MSSSSAQPSPAQPSPSRPSAAPPVAATRGGAAPRVARVLHHARFEMRILLGNGEQLMVAILMPAFVLLAMRFLPLVPGTPAERLDQAVAATAATALIATAFTSQSIQTGFDRRAGVLRWIATTPLGRDGYLAGKILATLAVNVVQIVVLGALSLALGWHPSALGLLGAVPVWLLGTIAFGSLGLLIAGTLRTEAVLALSNILFLLFITLGGVTIPPARFPRVLQGLVDLLPSGALGELMRACLAGHGLVVGPLLVLLAWDALGVLAVTRWFRWTSR